MKRSLGGWGEQLALSHLRSRGFRLRDRNWRCPSGEIDLVMQDGETLVFVEVKTRASSAFGAPEDAVTKRKRSRLRRVAEAYLDAHGLGEAAWRIDVVAIERPAHGAPRIEHYPDAVEADPTEHT